MTKLAVFPLLLIAACLIAGLYGALHNQVSYTAGPDYFHAFKFRQFQIPENLHNRVGAALVGWQASWWMGLIIGLPILLLGLLLPGWKAYLYHCFIAFGVVAGTAFVIGLAALVVATFTITGTMAANLRFPDGVVDKVAFVRAGTMHDFSYLGGFLGLLVGLLYLLIVRGRIRS